MLQQTQAIAGKLARFAVVALLVLTLAWLFSGETATKATQPADITEVSVTVVRAGPATARIDTEATGITQARWMTAVTASVEGRVEQLSGRAVPGERVAKGEVLVTLQDTSYLAEVKAAEARVAQARLELATNEKHQLIAKQVDQAPTAFGRFEPHVHAAQANLQATIAALAVARQQLEDTRIQAPFDAVIISDSVSPGAWVNGGETLFTIAASDSLDIKVELPATDWNRIRYSFQSDKHIKVVAPDDQTWPAKVRYLSPVMDPVTRQRSMMLQVDAPYEQAHPLLPDQQVQVIFTSDPLDNVFEAPASVLTQDGKVWSVKDHQLQLETIELLAEQTEQVLFRFTERPEQERLLVRYPLGSMLQGQTIDHLEF